MAYLKTLIVFFCLAAPIQAADYALLDFSAPWCGPCRMMKPHFKHPEVVELLKKVEFFEINTDQEREYAQSFKITSIPTVILVKRVDGKAVELRRVVGYQSVDQLKKLLLALPPQE